MADIILTMNGASNMMDTLHTQACRRAGAGDLRQQGFKGGPLIWGL